MKPQFKLLSNKVTFALVLLPAVIGCYSNQNLSSLTRKQIIRTDEKYIRQYGQIKDSNLDTIKNGRYTRVYKGGKLASVGRIKENIKQGDWYFYDSSLQLSYIVRYNKTESDTLKNPLAIINQHW